MTFRASGDAYDRFMGRYSALLAPKLIEFAGVEPGMRAVDVGCGPGGLTRALADQVGAENVAAADPSEVLAAACAERVARADVRVAGAEKLPWDDDTYDVGLSQLVVNFMDDAVAGVGQMCRVVRTGGVVASCTWDYGDGMVMLRTFWDVALAFDPDAPDEGRTMRFGTRAELRGLWSIVGLENVDTAALVVDARYEDFDDFWEPFMLGVGPGGAYCASLDPDRRDALREECRRRLGDPEGPFRLPARAWAVRGEVR